MEVKTNKKKWLPLFLATPTIGIGILSNLNGTIIPLLVERVTSSTELLSLIVAMGSVATILGSYIAGSISDRLHTKVGKRKPMIIISTIMLMIGLYFLGISNEYIEVFIFATVVYFGLNFYSGAYYAWFPEAVNQDQIGTVNGWSKLFYNLGGIIIFGVGVTLINISPLLPLILTMIIIIIFTISVLFGVKENVEMEKKEEKIKLTLGFLKNKEAMKLFIGGAFATFNLGLFMAYWIPYFKRMNGFSSESISYALTILSIVGLLGLFMGVLCDKFDKRKILLLAIGLQIIAFAMGLFITDLLMLYIFAAVFGAGFVMFMVSMFSIIPYICPRERIGEYMGVWSMFMGIGGLIANLVGGFIVGSQFIGLLFPVCLAFLIIGFLIILIGRIKLREAF